MKKNFYLVVISILIISCGESDASKKQLDIITDTEKIYTFDDLKSIGFKKIGNTMLKNWQGLLELILVFGVSRKVNPRITK